MANKKKADSSEWKKQRPKHGSSTKTFRDWAKKNPNRVVRAKEAIKETDPNSSSFIATTTETKLGTPARKEAVKKWQAARPVSGKGKSKTDQEKKNRQDLMVNWSQWNPNKRSNAQRVVNENKPPKPKKP